MLVAGFLASIVAFIAIGLRTDVFPVERAKIAVCEATMRACAVERTLSEVPPELGGTVVGLGETPGAAESSTLVSPSASVGLPADVVSLTRELVSIDSSTGKEQVAGAYIAAWLRSRGWVVSTPPVIGGRFNVVAFPRALRHLHRANVVLSTHFDTVPASKCRPRVENGRLYGRGAVDAKGILASMMLAAQKMMDRTPDLPLALLFVCGEETDHAGMIAANTHGFSPTIALINGEPTVGRVCVSQKGILKVVLDATGVSCHSGYPELGVSAIDALLEVLADLRAKSWKKDPKTKAEVTMNVGMISGGTAANVIPGSASATISFRIVASGEDVLEEVRAIVNAARNVTISSVFQNPPQEMYIPQRAAAEFGTYTAAYNTDLAYFKRASKKVLFGGGTIANAHVDDEFVELNALAQMPDQYETIVTELLEEHGQK